MLFLLEIIFKVTTICHNNHWQGLVQRNKWPRILGVNIVCFNTQRMPHGSCIYSSCLVSSPLTLTFFVAQFYFLSFTILSNTSFALLFNVLLHPLPYFIYSSFFFLFHLIFGHICSIFSLCLFLFCLLLFFCLHLLCILYVATVVWKWINAM